MHFIGNTGSGNGGNSAGLSVKGVVANFASLPTTGVKVGDNFVANTEELMYTVLSINPVVWSIGFNYKGLNGSGSFMMETLPIVSNRIKNTFYWLYELVNGVKVFKYVENADGVRFDITQEMQTKITTLQGLVQDAIDGNITAVLESQLVATDIANKLNAKEIEYAPRLTNAETQLAHISKVAPSGDTTGHTDTLNFNIALENKKLLLTNGIYYINNTLKFKEKSTMKGVYRQSIVNFVADNKVLLLGNEKVDNTTSFYNCIIEDVDFIGLGKSFNQTGFLLKGYKSEVKRCTFTKFKRNEKSGVKFNFEDNLISLNGIGVSIQDLVMDNLTLLFNTMLVFKGNRFLGNDLGLCNIGDGQTYNNGTENVLDLTIHDNTFEFNTKAFNLQPYSGEISHCWFEGNTTKPSLKKWSWIFESNRFETSGQEFEYLVGDKVYTGIIESTPRFGIHSAKTYDLQRYDATAQDVSSKKIEERQTGMLPSTVDILDSVDNTSRSIAEINPITLSTGTTARRFNKISHIGIKPEGTLWFKGSDIKHVGFAISKLATGRYKITFSTGILEGIPQIFVTSPASASNDNDLDMFYCTTRMRNTSSNLDYATYLSFNVLYINTYNRPTGGGVDVLADAMIYITLFHG